ncbi:MAG: HDOD domain-containing protein [Dehalococcoidia bacterium]|nr:HDOD domain-containing protein [Dehalococcoidia bacterium]MCA9853322.1 HDOD domain-containing protein [Dehalococcoidia bacterium]
MGNDARQLLERVEDLPPLPAVAARVMTMADDANSSALDMAQVLSSDQALTAKLIRISNSAYYGFARKVSTVREAVVVLGMKQVRQVAVGASLMNSFNGRRIDDDVFDIDLFWGHSVAVAIAAETIAKKTRAARPEDAFTAGILHDIGRLVLRQVMPHEFRSAVVMAIQGTPLHVAELETTGYAHDEIGLALGEKWKFPTHLVDAVAHHHREGLSPEHDGLEGVVALANALVLHYGLYCGFDVEDAELVPIPPELDRVETMCGGIDHLLDRSFAFIESASGTPQRWYAGAA